MNWTDERPTKPGFYYWQDQSLRNISEFAVRVVQVAKYKNRDGFNCETLGGRFPSQPLFDCDLGQEPAGRWAGPLPQPGVMRRKVPPPPHFIERFEQLEQERDRFKAFAEWLAGLCIKHGVIADAAAPVAGVTVTVDLTKKA